MKQITVFLLLFLSVASMAQKKMCITVDDLPMVRYGVQDVGHESLITAGLLKAFKKHDVPAIGYVNESKLYLNNQLMPGRVAHLENWLKEGYELGNHTYSHKNYHKTSFEEYSKDILRGEQVIKRLAEKYDQEVKYFRHPYLRRGDTKERVDSLGMFLSESGYTIAPVTIDNAEYLFAKAFAVAHLDEDPKLKKQIGKAYLEYMEGQVDYYEKASNTLFERNISQTLLIHANYLNATYLDDLLSIYEERGYTFVSQEEVLQDPAYQSEITKFNDWGISWIQWWGMSKGLKGTFLQGEAEVPALVRELAAR